MLRVEPATAGLRARLILLLLKAASRFVHGRFAFGGVEVEVPKGCFAPVFVSTRLALEAALQVADGSTGCEIGAGSGALSIALAKRLGVEMVATDVDLRCLRESVGNAKRNGVYALYSPVACSEASCLRSGVFDFAVANPPYLPLKPGKGFTVALCGGERLEIYLRILADAVRVLKEGGILVFTASTVTGRVKGAKLLAKRRTPIDTVLAFAYAKNPGGNRQTRSPLPGLSREEGMK